MRIWRFAIEREHGAGGWLMFLGSVHTYRLTRVDRDNW
jgi:hypothetical protein